MSLLQTFAEDLAVTVKYLKKIRSRPCVYLRADTEAHGRELCVVHDCRKRYQNQEAWCGTCLAAQALDDIGDRST